MTGFATKSTNVLWVEIKTVNSRFLDIAFKLSERLRVLEVPLRALLSARIRRGKVEVRLFEMSAPGNGVNEGNSAVLAARIERVINWERVVLQSVPTAKPLSVAEILGCLRSQEEDSTADRGGGDGVDSQLLQEAQLALRVAIDALLQSRAREGAQLCATMLNAVGVIRALTTRVQPLVGAALQAQRVRFVQKFEEGVGALAAQLGAGAHAIAAHTITERALAEAAAHAMRVDVAEELARLRTHLDEIEHLLRSGGEIGKRLEFLIQELQREANTLGSKSASVEITSIAVDMKVLIEQLREQVQNIE